MHGRRIWIVWHQLPTFKDTNLQELESLLSMSTRGPFSSYQTFISTGVKQEPNSGINKKNVHSPEEFFDSTRWIQNEQLIGRPCFYSGLV